METKHIVADHLEKISEEILEKYYHDLKEITLSAYGKVNDKKIELIIKKADITLKRQIELLRTGKREFLSGMSETDFAKKCLIPKVMTQKEIDRIFQGIELFSVLVMSKLFESLSEKQSIELEKNKLLPIVITLVATFYEDLWLSTMACLKHEQEISEQLFSDMIRLLDKEKRTLIDSIKNELTESITLMKSRFINLSHEQKYQFILPDIVMEIENFAKMLFCGVRNIFFDISEKDEDKRTFLPFLSNYFADFESRTGIYVQFNTENIENEPSRKMWVHIFRIIQETLNNVKKHSQASEVKINLSSTEQYLTLIIQDNGIGFKPETKNNKSENNWLPFGHYGLVGLEQRVKMLGGKFIVTSEEDLGTTIKAIIPMLKELPFDKTTRTEYTNFLLISKSEKNNPIFLELENRNIFKELYCINVMQDYYDIDNVVNKTTRLFPKVIVLDLKLSNDSYKLVKKLKEALPNSIFISLIPDTLDTLKVLEAGIDSAILQDTPLFQACDIIEAASHGYILIDPRVQKTIQKEVSLLLHVQSALKTTDLSHTLTEREKDIISLVEEGFSNKEIAEQLFISLSTVKVSLAHIYDKLGCSNRAEAVAKIRQGYLKWDELPKINS
ncbi:MAG: LuxR C-terminal-related transcriptional regulator [Bacillota bacterium]